MERYFMSRSSAIGLLVDTRQALAADLHEKSPPGGHSSEQMLRDIERLLLDVRVGRTREFRLEFPSQIHVIVSD
jgi:hypothetical protein